MDYRCSNLQETLCHQPTLKSNHFYILIISSESPLLLKTYFSIFLNNMLKLCIALNHEVRVSISSQNFLFSVFSFYVKFYSKLNNNMPKLCITLY